MRSSKQKTEVVIENLGRLPRAVVEDLRSIVANLDGPPEECAHRDPARRGFYILRGEARAFYVAVTPSARKLLLLASWPTRGLDALDCAAD